MKRVMLAILILPFITTVLMSQDNDRRLPNTACALSKTQVQNIRGFNLGNKWEQVVARFPGLLKESMRARQVEMFSSGECYILSEAGKKMVSHFKPSKFPIFNEVSSIRLRFFEGEIIFIKVTYDGTTHWKTLDDFAMKISEGLSLPPAWQHGASLEERVLECQAFKVTASLEAQSTSTCTPPFCGPPEKQVYLPTVALEDTTVSERAKERLLKQLEKQREEQERREEEKRRTFKP